MRLDFSLYKNVQVDDGKGSFKQEYQEEHNIFGTKKYHKVNSEIIYKVDKLKRFIDFTTRICYDIEYKDIIKDKTDNIYYEVYAIQKPSNKNRLYQDILLKETDFKIENYIQQEENGD